MLDTGISPLRFEPPKTVDTFELMVTLVLFDTEVASPPPYTVPIVPPFIRTLVVPVVPPWLLPPYTTSDEPPVVVTWLVVTLPLRFEPPNILVDEPPFK